MRIISTQRKKAPIWGFSILILISFSLHIEDILIFIFFNLVLPYCHMVRITVEPVKLNTCVHWTPAYIEQLFMSRHTPIENQWEATWIHWTPVYLEHWTPNLFPQATFNLSTLNILHLFERFHWIWEQMRYIRLTVLLSDIFQRLNMWSLYLYEESKVKT